MLSESTVSLQRISYVSSARVRKFFVLGDPGVDVLSQEEDVELAVLDSFSNFSCTWNVMSWSRFSEYGYIRDGSVSVLEEICLPSTSIEH